MADKDKPTHRDQPPRSAPEAGEAIGKHPPSDEQLRQNREKLRVNDEHKTPEMEKGKRGGFP